MRTFVEVIRNPSAFKRSDAVPVSGLVLRFSPDSGLLQAALDALQADSRIEIGPASDHQLPIVIETSDAEESSAIWEWLNSLPGVTFVDLAFVNFEDSGECPADMEAP